MPPVRVIGSQPPAWPPSQVATSIFAGSRHRLRGRQPLHDPHRIGRRVRSVCRYNRWRLCVHHTHARLQHRRGDFDARTQGCSSDPACPSRSSSAANTSGSGCLQLCGGDENQYNTANGVEALGAGNTLFDTILGSSVAGARTAFTMLSGEAHASAVQVAYEDGRLVREAILTRLRTLWARTFQFSRKDPTTPPMRPIRRGSRNHLWLSHPCSIRVASLSGATVSVPGVACAPMAMRLPSTHQLVASSSAPMRI